MTGNDYIPRMSLGVFTLLVLKLQKFMNISLSCGPFIFLKKTARKDITRSFLLIVTSIVRWLS